MRMSDLSSDVCASDLAAGVGSRAAAAARVGRAQAHAGDRDLSDPLVGGEAFGRRQPDELDAFLLGIRHFALRPRHIVAVAAIEAFDRFRALAHRGADAVHRENGRASCRESGWTYV